MARCGDCCFWDGPRGDNNCGGCHRFPPVLVPGSVDRDDYFTHPNTHEENWCGEYRNKIQRGLETGGPW